MSPIPSNSRETFPTRPRTMIYNRFWFHPPVMPEVFRTAPVPVVRVEPRVAKTASEKDEEFFGGAVSFEDMYGR